jgi:acetoin utilization deacetylase AcuC-like enzyme
VAEIAPCAREQLLRGGAVHVDVLIIREDDLGQMGLVEADYVYITRKMMDVADEFAEGRIVSSLEGGYNLSALARSVGAHLRTLAQL